MSNYVLENNTYCQDIILHEPGEIINSNAFFKFKSIKYLVSFCVVCS